jgi:large repetitive protein
MLMLLPFPLVASGTTTYTATKLARVDPTNNATTPAGWNAWQGNASGIPAAITLFASDNSATGWGINTSVQWTLANTGATTNNNTGAYPDAVIVSNWYNGASISNPALVRFTGLNVSRVYDIGMLGSRGGGTNDRGTQYGIGSDIRNQISDANTTRVALFPKIAPDASGVITVKIATGTGTNGTNGGFCYFNGCTIQEYVAS